MVLRHTSLQNLFLFVVALCVSLNASNTNVLIQISSINFIILFFLCLKNKQILEAIKVNYSNNKVFFVIFLANLGDVPGETLSVDEFPQWLNWNTYYNVSERYAQITGTTPSQDIAYGYNFTVRSYDAMNFDLAIPATFNDRDYELNVLADATCVSPVNNICT